MENTDALFELLMRIKKTDEGTPRHEATIDFYNKLESTIDGFSSINKDTEFHSVDHYFNDSAVYTTSFKNYMNSAIDLFLSTQSDNAKYVSVGRLFSSFKCRRNNFSDRLKTHILNMHRIKHYNKKIMMEKLEHLLAKVKILIGNCDTNLEQYMIKSPKRHFTRSVAKLSAAVQSMKHAADNFLFEDVSKLKKEDIDSIDTARDQAVNLARQETIVLCNMRSENIVSVKELDIEKKSNSTFWLINPLVITSLTTMNSIALTMSGSSVKASTTEGISHMSEVLHIAATGLASALMLPIAPATAFVTAYVASKLSKLEIVQHLTNNKRIRDEFHAAIKKINRTAERCSYSKDKSDYIRRHTDTGVLISDYNKICKEKYDPILQLCDYFTDTYELICTEPVELSRSRSRSKSGNKNKSKTVRQVPTAREGGLQTPAKPGRDGIQMPDTQHPERDGIQVPTAREAEGGLRQVPTAREAEGGLQTPTVKDGAMQSRRQKTSRKSSAVKNDSPQTPDQPGRDGLRQTPDTQHPGRDEQVPTARYGVQTRSMRLRTQN